MQHAALRVHHEAGTVYVGRRPFAAADQVRLDGLQLQPRQLEQAGITAQHLLELEQPEHFIAAKSPEKVEAARRAMPAEDAIDKRIDRGLAGAK